MSAWQESPFLPLDVHPSPSLALRFGFCQIGATSGRVLQLRLAANRVGTALPLFAPSDNGS
jgi:hypothetical protein